MNTAATEFDPIQANETRPADAKPTSLASVPHPLPLDDPDAIDVACARAERAVFRDGIIGALLGVLILAPTWAGLVALAVRNSGTALWPAALMAAGVGVIAGVFMGGWAGTLVGSRALEHFEHEILPPNPR